MDSFAAPDSTRPSLTFERAAPIFLLTLVDVLGLSLILPLLHLYAARFSATPFEIGVVMAAFPLAQLIGVPFMGALSDRFGRKPLLLISQITTCIGFILLGAATTLPMVIFSRVLDGLFGANLATAQAAISDVTDDKTRAQGLGLTGAAFGLGFIFGPLISLVALEFTDDLAIPAYIAAGYSFVSIVITLFMFRETNPPEMRAARLAAKANQPRTPLRGQLIVISVLLVAQQVVFFGFETLLGLFTLSQLGLMGQGNSLIFIVVGVTLVFVQLRLIGKWSRRYGERNLAVMAMALIGVGLILLSFTPRTPHPLYIRQIVERKLVDQNISSAEAVLGDIPIDLPPDETRGLGGIVWTVIVIVPIAIGSGLIRPALNSLLTRRAPPAEYGRMLGISSALVSGANAAAPLLGAYLFQQAGATFPYLVGGLMMSALAILSVRVLQPLPHTSGSSQNE